MFLRQRCSHGIFRVIRVLTVASTCVWGCSHGFVWLATTTYKVNLLTSSRHILSFFTFLSWQYTWVVIPSLSPLIHCTSFNSYWKHFKRWEGAALFNSSALASWPPGHRQGVTDPFFPACRSPVPGLSAPLTLGLLLQRRCVASLHSPLSMT